jgi:preprotein translocase subunit SecF
MEETTLIQSIPFTAWEQAVFVVLFIVFVIGLLVWFGKQSDKWQQFIAEMDDKWRLFNKEQRDQNLCAMDEVRNSVLNLTTVTQGLVQEVKEMRDDSMQFYREFAAHDNQAKVILQEVKNGNTPKPKAKTKEKVNGSD